MRKATLKAEIWMVDKASKAANAITKSVNKMTSTVKQQSAIAGKSFSSFSNKVGMSVKKATVSLNNLNARVNQVGRNIKKRLGGLGQLGLGVGLAMIVSTIVSANVKLDDSFASLSAITGKTGDQFDVFKTQVNEVAKAQILFAGDTAKAFEVVASAQPILLGNAKALGKVTNAAITLSKASGDDLASSALSLTGVMNQFNLAANDSGRVMNALAAGSVAGSANITNVAASMKNFGAVASAANLEVEQAIALVEVMGSKSIFAEDAGNKLKASVLNLQAAGLGYQSGLFNMADALEEVKTKVDAARTAKEKDAIVTSVFKKTGIATGQILLNNIDMYREMTTAVTGTTTAVDQMNTKANTFSNRWAEITASFKNNITATDSQSESMQKLKDFMLLVSENMDKIISTVITGIKIFLAFKAVTLGLKAALFIMRAATFAYNVVLGVQSALLGNASIAMKGNTVAIGVMNVVTKAISIATKGWIIVQKALNAAMKANLLGLIITGIMILIGVVVLLVKHWDVVKVAMVSFYDKIRSNPILSFLLKPIIMVVEAVKLLIQSFKNIFQAFKFGGLVSGFKAIGKSILNFMILPFKVFLEALAKIPKVGKFAQIAVDKINKFQNKVDPNVESGKEKHAISEISKSKGSQSEILQNKVNGNLNNKTANQINKSTEVMKSVENFKTNEAFKTSDSLNSVENFKTNQTESIVNNISNNKSNEVFKTSEIAKTAIIKEQNIINTQKEVFKTNELSQKEIVTQKSVSNTENSTSITPRQSRSNKQEITINVVDKTNSNYGIEVESTGITVKTTGND